MKSPAFGSGPIGMDFFTLEEAAERMSNLLGKKITPSALRNPRNPHRYSHLSPEHSHELVARISRQIQVRNGEQK